VQILIVTAPYHGHVQPHLLIAKKLFEHDNEVMWYTGARFKDSIEATGATHVSMEGYAYDDRDMDSAFPERRHDEGVEKFKRDIKRLFMDAIPSYHQEMQHILETFPAQVVVFDLWCLGVLPMILTGEPKGLKFVSTGLVPLTVVSPDAPPFGPGFPVQPGVDERERNIKLHDQFQNEIFADVQEYFNHILTEQGSPPTDVYWAESSALLSNFFLQFTIPSFEYPRSDLPSHVRFVGPMLIKGEEIKVEELPDWWHELNGERPVIHVTQGTLDTSNFQRLILPTIQALADEEVLVVASTGGRPVSDLGADLPDNVRVVEYIPYHQFLPHVDAMVSNGGYGGVQYALSHGIPLVVAGDTEDKPEVAQRVRWSGAGINLETGSPTVEQIHKAVNDILEDPQYRIRAKALQAEYAQYDAVNESVRLIEQMATDAKN